MCATAQTLRKSLAGVHLQGGWCLWSSIKLAWARHIRRNATMLSIPPELARSALEAAPDAMIIIDASGTIRFTNRQLFALFG